MKRLEQKLRAKIVKSGPITYHEFVETALFDPQDGYYRNGKPDRRDFLTSPEVHPVFGETIAHYALKLAEGVDERQFSILELGGGSGRLGGAVIKALPSSRLARYVILEKAQKDKGEGMIEWVSSAHELPVFSGFTFVIANEFFDALPFHRVVMREGKLREVYLDMEDGFLDVPLPVSPDLAAFLEAYPLYLNDDQSLEVTPDLTHLCSAFSKKIKKGVLLVFDYGYHLEDIASGAFFDGSMVSYRNYVMHGDIFSAIGQRDISHHVNFDHLATALMRAGWKKIGEIPQYRFLHAAGIGARIHSLPGGERGAAKMLLDPEGIGSAFRVLAFVKGETITLSGF